MIDGRFELMERLGGGGMGLVWRAWDVALHREVALKEVRPPDPSMDEQDPTRARELRARVLREARALARLNHPHVVTIHHIVDPGEQGYPWLVMELVTGGSLQNRLQRGPMSPAEAARLGREVLSALRAAHAVGIQHRDVKPGNVLLREDGRSVLTDFGIAAVRESTSLTATGSFIGSPEYMAPERINGYEGDPASDLWSLGMLLYVAVEGRHPLRRSTTLATLAAVLNQDVPHPERAGPLGPVLLALLRRDPAARPDAETLDRLLTSAAEPGSGPGLLPPSRPAGPGHPTPVAARPHGPAGGPPMAGHTVPPGYGGHAAPQPPPWAAAPISQVQTVRSRRTGRAARNVGTALSLAALVVAGVLVWRFLPITSTTTTPSGDDPTALSVTPAASSDPETPAETKTESSEPENLLTPADMRAMIAKVKEEIGGSKVAGMTVYPTYALIEAPTAADKEVYDRYNYRDGAVSRFGSGGVLIDPLVDLDKYDWNALPGLVKKANKDLGVPEPTTRYVIVGPDSTSGTPVLRVYVSDSYHRTGYLVANLQGKVVRTYPHS
ncbi:serine/threonine protein kinase [Nonomuraea turkmeniaca]|uniref:non-specific serine/threonine protein kinase n=1 Tax=Nonomuraea turkmeniaca TaxID=103838 RepID=A0A5S4FXW7_9ACTN|nr:serine/threonine protein kinase [Nonomuraea turkmeniaca]